jgi:hypothetical protein
VAASVWFGKGDFITTENLTFGAADFSDTDCNAANAGSVIGAMHGMAALPKEQFDSFNDRVKGEMLGPVKLTPPLDESISRLAERTAAIGEKILLSQGAKLQGDKLDIPTEQPKMLEPELFTLADLGRMWNPDWTLERAGYGGAGGGLKGVRGDTYLDGETLAIFPRDEVRGALLRRSVQLSGAPSISFDAGADAGHAWRLAVFIDNDKVLEQLIDGGWKHVSLDLSGYRNQTVVIRLYDMILVPGHEAGNSYWKNLTIR